MPSACYHAACSIDGPIKADTGEVTASNFMGHQNTFDGRHHALMASPGRFHIWKKVAAEEQGVNLLNIQSYSRVRLVLTNLVLLCKDDKPSMKTKVNL